MHFKPTDYGTLIVSDGDSMFELPNDAVSLYLRPKRTTRPVIVGVVRNDRVDGYTVTFAEDFKPSDAIPISQLTSLDQEQLRMLDRDERIRLGLAMGSPLVLDASISDGDHRTFSLDQIHRIVRDETNGIGAIRLIVTPPE
jgi:hypothetical protein